MLVRTIRTAWIPLAIASYLVLVPGVVVAALFLLLRPNIVAQVCDRPELKFAGTDYRIETCITSDFDTRQKIIRLRIYDRGGRQLLAHRRFIFLMDYTLGEIEYLENGIRYTDATKTQNIDLPEEKFLRFPPSHWDWLTANLVRLTYDP